MPKIVEGQTYLNTEEAISVLGISKQSFYTNARPYLKARRFDAKRAPWYNEIDVLALKSGKPARKASIGISGILGDWTTFLASLGFQAETKLRSIDVVTLPEDAAKTFSLPADKKFVKRSRMTFANGTPICAWDTYYPLEFVEDILEQMEQGTANNIVEYIQQTHGVFISVAKDKYSARLTTLEEQNLFQLATDEAVLILQRVSYTKDKKVLVLYSDMVLLGNWFAPEYEYEVHNWDK